MGCACQLVIKENDDDDDDGDDDDDDDARFYDSQCIFYVSTYRLDDWSPVSLMLLTYWRMVTFKVILACVINPRSSKTELINVTY